MNHKTLKLTQIDLFFHCNCSVTFVPPTHPHSGNLTVGNWRAHNGSSERNLMYTGVHSIENHLFQSQLHLFRVPKMTYFCVGFENTILSLNRTWPCQTNKIDLFLYIAKLPLLQLFWKHLKTTCKTSHIWSILWVLGTFLHRLRSLTLVDRNKV